MISLAKQNIIVILLLILFTFPVFISTLAAVFATFNNTNNTNSTSTGQSNQELIVTSKGCGEGYGYYVDDPNPICEPLDKIGQGPPSDMAFCAALGCPYNPPAETELPAADNGDKNNFATTPVTPTEEPAVGAQPQPQPQPEPDPGDGNNNQDGGEAENQNENSDGGDGDGSTEEEGDNSDEQESEE